MDNTLSTMQDIVTIELSGIEAFLGRVRGICKQRVFNLLIILTTATLFIALSTIIKEETIAETIKPLTVALPTTENNTHQTDKTVKKLTKKVTVQTLSHSFKRRRIPKPLITAPRDSDKVMFYVQLLEDKTKPWFYRNDAARELGLAGDKRAIEPLIHALATDDHPFTRREAALALSKLNDRTALEPLTRASLDDNNEWVRQYAADAIEGLIANKVIIGSNNSP
jgi:hypothetical protein